jgi:Fe-S oxidoreductase
MCFKYCDSFPILFDLIDNHYEGDVRKITGEQRAQIFDACFQCKLCEVECPYTPRSGHEFQLDFPKLVHRFRAVVDRKRRKLTLRERVLGNPDATGKMARASFGMANLMNRFGPNRYLMEKAVGIHRQKLLPDFASKSFEHWAKREDLISDEPGGEVVLFQTCFVQHNAPEVGRDTIDVLRRNGVDVRCAAGLVCCGMPAWEHGDLASLRKQASRNLDKLLPFVERGAKVLIINPTCSMMMRREYPELLEGSDRERARKLAEAVFDVSEFLWSIRNEERFNTAFKSTPGEKIAYHAPCHLRAQGVGFKGRDLLRKIPGVKPATVMECCGHNGTFAMTVEGFEPSQRLGKKAFDGMNEAGAEVWATDCPLAAIQFEQHAGCKPLHPMSILARAYREDGFPGRVGDDEA